MTPPPAAPRPGDLLTTTDVAALIGSNPAAIRARLLRGTIPTPDQRLGEKPIWRRSTIDKWAPGGVAPDTRGRPKGAKNKPKPE